MARLVADPTAASVGRPWHCDSFHHRHVRGRQEAPLELDHPIARHAHGDPIGREARAFFERGVTLSLDGVGFPTYDRQPREQTDLVSLSFFNLSLAIRNASRNCLRSPASRVENGSSSSMSRRWRARATRCCWPPDSWCGCRPAIARSSSTRSMSACPHANASDWSRMPKQILARTVRCGNNAPSGHVRTNYHHLSTAFRQPGRLNPSSSPH